MKRDVLSEEPRWSSFIFPLLPLLMPPSPTRSEHRASFTPPLLANYTTSVLCCSAPQLSCLILFLRVQSYMKFTVIDVRSAAPSLQRLCGFYKRNVARQEGSNASWERASWEMKKSAFLESTEICIFTCSLAVSNSTTTTTTTNNNNIVVL